MELDQNTWMLARAYSSKSKYNPGDFMCFNSHHQFHCVLSVQGLIIVMNIVQQVISHLPYDGKARLPWCHSWCHSHTRDG